jgi:Concanavalin A-like lectin/glucanases superfamily
MRRRLLLALLVALALSAPASARAATLLYPNLKTLAPRNLRFDRTDVSADSSGVLHNVLRFSNTVENVGEGPLEIRATIDMSLNPPSGPAYQRIYDTSGGFTDVPLTGSTLYYHAVHKHYHFDNWGAYQLWTKSAYDAWIASGRTSGSPDLVGEKTTSCVEDEEFVSPVPAAVWPASYPPNCMPNSQNVIDEGLSPGWGDTYDYYRFQQWIDLGQSTLADGTYVLRSVTDPDNIVYESASKADPSRESAQDNESTTTFTVSGGKILDSDPPTGTVTINNIDATTSSPKVTLAVLGRDDVSGVDQFRVSNDGSSWATYTNTSYDSVYQTLPWDLTDAAHGGSGTTGIRTVYVQFHDAAGHWGPTETDTIDYEPPQPPPPVTSAYGKAVQGDGPVSWWRLGESSGSTAADQMGLNPGTYSSGGVTLAQPTLIPSDTQSTAVAFNGSSGSVKVPASASLNVTNAFSLEAWIKPSSLPATGSFASVVTKAESYSLQFNGPKMEFTVIQSGTRRRCQAPAGAVVAGSTYHVVGTFDGATQRLYLNGAQVASCALTGSASVTTNPLYVGSWNGGSELFNGTIDEPAVYAKALSAAQVKAHYDAASTAVLNAPSGLTAAASSSSQIDLSWTDTSSGETGEVLERSTSSSFSTVASIQLPAGTQSYSDTALAPSTTYWYRVKSVAGTSASPYSGSASATTPAPPTYRTTVLGDRPLSYWRLDETGGTVAGDQTVANPGTFAGGVTLGVPGLLSSDPANGALGYDGVSGDVRVGQSGALDLTTAMTLETWIRPTSLPPPGSSRTIFAKTGSYALQLNGSQLAFTIVQLGVRRQLLAPAGTIVAGGAYYVVGTFDGATQRLYVNGVQVASGALSGAADLTLGGIHIGSWDGSSEFYAGTIDDTALYTKVLSASQIATHYSMAKAPLGAPSNLAGTGISQARIDLSWSDNAGAETGQVLQRSSDASFSAPTSISLPADVQSYSDTGLTAGTTYYYRVKAVTATDSSAWSPTASASTLAPVPYATVVTGDAPVSYWRLGESSGTVAADQLSANPGTYSAMGATLGATSLLATAPTNTALGLDGVTGSVKVAQSTSLSFTNAFSLEAWIKPASLPATGGWASVVTKAESYSLQFNGPRMEFTVIQSGTRRRCQAPAGAVVAGSTDHVVGTFDGATQRLYLNGAQVASCALTGSASVTTNPLYLGSWDGSSELLKGTLDEVAVYNSVLSATQVARHYAAGTTG